MTSEVVKRAQRGDVAALRALLESAKRRGTTTIHFEREIDEALKIQEYKRQAAEAQARIDAANARIAQSKTLVQENASLNRQNTTTQDTAQVVEGGTALQTAPAGAATGSDWLAKRKKSNLASSLGVNV